MEQMNRDELRNALIAKRLIDYTGTVNAVTINCISGAHTWPLLSEIWDLSLGDMDAMEEIQTFLNKIYEKE